MATEKQRLYAKEYRKNHLQQIKEKQKEYYLKHREYVKDKSAKYYEDNKEKVLKRHCNYLKDRKLNDTVFRQKESVRLFIQSSFRRACNGKYKKSKRAEEILGCSMDFFMNYIESKFQEGMSFDNYGEWHIDHIIPLSSAKTEEGIYELCHYTNLQPLWAKDNIAKSNKSVL